MTYYEILEVREDASKEVINMAYKALAKKYHPDVYKGCPENATEIIQKINEAFEILSDETKRMEYDTMLRYLRQENQNEQHEEAASNEPFPIELSPLSTRWFSFYCNIWLPLTAIGGVASIIIAVSDSAISNIFSGEYILNTSILLFLLLLLDVSALVLALYLAVTLRRRTPRSFMINRIFLIICPTIKAISEISETSASSFHVSQELLILFVPCVIFYFLNVIYFEKRKFLFITTVTPYDNYKPALYRILGCMIAFALVMSSMSYFVYDKPLQKIYNSNSVNNIVEEDTDLETTLYWYDKLARLYNFKDHTELSNFVADDLGINMNSLTMQEQYEKIVTEYYALESYNNAFGLVDSYANKVINSFGAYQQYSYAAIKEYENSQTDNN